MASGSAYWDPRAAAESVASEPRWIWHWQRHRECGHAAGFMTGRWEDRNWLNVPGPFYGAFTDTCLAGIPAAPGNVLCEDGMEFVWRQPRDLDEVRAVLDAAYQDPFHGYNWDGDEHWTPDLVWEWWEGRTQIDEWLARADLGRAGAEAAEAALEYRRYIARGLNDDLLRYADWLSARAG